MEQDMINLNQKIKELSHKNDSLTQKSENYYEELVELRNERKFETNNDRQMHRSMIEMNVVASNKANNMKQLENKLTELERKLQQSKSANDRLQKMYDTKVDSIGKVQQECDLEVTKHRQTIHKLKTEQTSLKDKISTLKAQIEKMTVKHQDHVSHLKDMLVEQQEIKKNDHLMYSKHPLLVL